MKITIDTKEDSKEDIRKIVAMLTNFLNGNESAVENSSLSGNLFENSGAGLGGFFDSPSEQTSQVAQSSSPSMVNNSQDQSLPFVNIFGDDASNSNSSAANNNNLNSNGAINTSSNDASSQVSQSPIDLFAFGNVNNNNNNINSAVNIGSQNVNNIKPAITSFKGVPVLNNLSKLDEDNLNDELTEEEKQAARMVVEY